jgi:hypothetical protein
MELKVRIGLKIQTPHMVGFRNSLVIKINDALTNHVI